MELTGEHRIPASRKVVWEALHDPDLLRTCITGCESLEFVEDDKMKARVTAKVGPVKATFDANVAIVDATEPEGYTLQGEGKGGVAGFAKGSAKVRLTEDGDATLLHYEADAKVGGKLAQLGSRLVDSTAKRYAADFFSCLSEKLGGGATADAAAPPPIEAAAIEGAPEGERVVAAAPVEPGAPSTAQAAAGAPTAAARSSAPAQPASNPPVPPEQAPKGGSSVWLWVALAIAVVAAAVYFMG